MGLGRPARLIRAFRRVRWLGVQHLHMPPKPTRQAGRARVAQAGPDDGLVALAAAGDRTTGMCFTHVLSRIDIRNQQGGSAKQYQSTSATVLRVNGSPLAGAIVGVV